MIKKRIISVVCVLVLIMSFYGCENEENTVTAETQQAQNDNDKQALQMQDISTSAENESEQPDSTAVTDYQGPVLWESDENAGTDDDFGDFGLTIKFPVNVNWIKILSHQINGNRLEIAYEDLITEADCTLAGVKGGELVLPEIDYGNATIEKREAFRSAIEGKTDNTVTFKQSENKKDILVTWEYEDYKFAIIGKLKGTNTDAYALADTAWHIIENYMEPASSENSNTNSNSAPKENTSSNTNKASTEAQSYSNDTEDAPADADGPYREAQPYPKEYEDLQAAISKGMLDKELPFVTSSAISENPLRVEVTVNTDDDVLLNKLKAYDKTGKMLKITYSAATAVLE